VRIKYTNTIAGGHDKAAIVLVEVDRVDLFPLFSGFHLTTKYSIIYEILG
jgi:hypothetical protein